MRKLPEWIGKTDDTPIPARVKLRVFERCAGRCQGDTCGGRKITPPMKWECDHVVAIANGGANAEFNLQVLCVICHLSKTQRDVDEKSRVVRKRLKHLGLRKAKGRPMPGTKASGIRKRMDGTVERR